MRVTVIVTNDLVIGEIVRVKGIRRHRERRRIKRALKTVFPGVVFYTTGLKHNAGNNNFDICVDYVDWLECGDDIVDKLVQLDWVKKGIAWKNSIRRLVRPRSLHDHIPSTPGPIILNMMRGMG